jgi:predicted nucleic acid-binding protein
VNLYAESSAILAWLLEEANGEAVRAHLGKAARVFSSELTLVECDRTVHRAVALDRLTEADAAAVRAMLSSASQMWDLLHFSQLVFERARRSFPVEPVRTLDAIHLATTVVASESVGPLAVLSLDERVRRNARALGFEVLPPNDPTYPQGRQQLIVRESDHDPIVVG